MVADHGSQHTPILPVSWGRMVSLTLVVLASVVLGYLVFERYLRVAATILVLAGMLTYLLKPTVDWLTRLRHLRHLPHARTSAVLLIYLVLASGLYFLGSGVAQTLFTDVRALTQTWASVSHGLRSLASQFTIALMAAFFRCPSRRHSSCT